MSEAFGNASDGANHGINLAEAVVGGAIGVVSVGLSAVYVKVKDALNARQERHRLQRDGFTPQEQLARVVELANEHALTAQGIRRSTGNIRELLRRHPQEISGRAAAEAIVALAQGALAGPGCLSGIDTEDGLFDLTQALCGLRTDNALSAGECAQALQALARTVGDRFRMRSPQQRLCLATLIDDAAGQLAHRDPPLLPHSSRIQLLADIAQSMALSDADLQPLMNSALMQDSGNSREEVLESLVQRLRAMTPSAPAVCVDHVIRLVIEHSTPVGAAPFAGRVISDNPGSLSPQTVRLVLDRLPRTEGERLVVVEGLAQLIGRHFRPELAHEVLSVVETWHEKAPTSPSHADLVRCLLRDAIPLATRLVVRDRLAAIVGTAQAAVDCRTQVPLKDALRDTSAGERARSLRAALELYTDIADQVEAVLACLDMDDWPAGLADGGLLPPSRVAQLIRTLGEAALDPRHSGRAEQIARLTQVSQKATDEALLRLAVDTLRGLPELKPVADDPEETARRTHRLQRCLLDACSSPSLYISWADARQAAQEERDLEPPTAHDSKSSDAKSPVKEEHPPIAALHPPWLTGALWLELTSVAGNRRRPDHAVVPEQDLQAWVAESPATRAASTPG